MDEQQYKQSLIRIEELTQRQDKLQKKLAKMEDDSSELTKNFINPLFKKHGINVELIVKNQLECLRYFNRDNTYSYKDKVTSQIYKLDRSTGSYSSYTNIDLVLRDNNFRIDSSMYHIEESDIDANIKLQMTYVLSIHVDQIKQLFEDIMKHFDEVQMELFDVNEELAKLSVDVNAYEYQLKVEAARKLLVVGAKLKDKDGGIWEIVKVCNKYVRVNAYGYPNKLMQKRWFITDIINGDLQPVK